ncbi:MAG: EAL domain-containing protein [Gammaproteobacteria bacterium]|nr:EAL domain-containing protein [Gammaproteobacteria bacterium]
MKMDENLHLLIVEESISDAESLANELRNSGHAIELAYAADLAAVESQISEHAPDIVIVGSGDNLPDAASITTTLERLGISAPVIAIGAEAPEDAVIEARKAGISALVSYDRPDHLPLVFKREAEIIALKTRLSAFTDTLQTSEKRAHALIENSSDAIAYIHDGMHVYANRPYLDLFDIDTSDDIDGLPVLDMISSDQRDKFRDFLKQLDNPGAQENSLDIDCINPNGEPFNSTMEFSPATMDGEACTQIIIRVNSGDNSELQKKIKSLSRQDMLTGLWNRQYFMKILEGQVGAGSSSKKQRALVYLTLDNFKIIREEAGIVASDLILCEIGNLLSRNIGEKDLLSRFGDYSFALLKQGTDMASLQATCQKLQEDIAGHTTEIDGRTFNMTASIGVCEINRHANDAQKIISFADMACEVARTSGGNQVHTHSTAVDDSIETDMEQDSDLIIRETIDNERFYLVYQPIVNLKGDKSEQYEILLRITDAGGNVILPGQFISIAERTGLAGEVDRWVINRAFETLQEYQQENEATFFIKITGASLADTGFVDWVGEKLKEYNLDGSAIVFEINERSALSNLIQATDFVGRMHEHGCRVALEHFGISEQAIQVMGRVPADIFKVDGSLIGEMSTNKDVQAKVRTFTEAIREKEAISIAECVDDAGVLALLWQSGFNSIQGFFVQEPVKELGFEFDSEIV